MTVFSFTVTIAGTDVMTDSAQDALFEAGCGDATFSAVGELQTAEFAREAAEFADAVAGAIKAIESAVPGVKVTEVRRHSEIATATT